MLSRRSARTALLVCAALVLAIGLSPSRFTARAATPQTGGVVLDGYGGLHPFGGFALATQGAPYWPGWDIARAVVVRADGAGGWILDGWGGVHAFGAAQAVGSHLTWPQQDVARALVITSRDAGGDVGAVAGQPGPVQGYVLDLHGGIHPFGGAPPVRSPGYWPAQDVASGLDVHLDAQGVPDGSLVLDLYGGLHYAGGYPAVHAAPAYFAGHPVYQRLGRSADGRLFAVTRYGLVTGLGAQDQRASQPAGLTVMPQPRSGGAPGASSWVTVPGRAVGPLMTMAPYWSGYADWGRWDILRDVAIARSDNPGATAQPASPDAVDQLQNAVTDLRTTYLNAPSLRQNRPLDCEAAATAAALATVGAGRSQDWVLAQLPVDRRGAQMRNGRPVRWGDAWTSFVGNVDAAEWNFTGYGVYWSPIRNVVAGTGRRAFGGQGWSVTDLYTELVRGHPVIIWINNSYRYVTPSHWTGWDGASVPYTVGDHTVLLYGVDFGNGTVHIMDDATGSFRTFSMSQFVSFMATYANMAVVVE